MKKTICLWLLFLPLSLKAATDVYRFDSVEAQQQFASLTAELRCLVCQNQTLAESNSSLAADLRDEIYQKVRQGEKSPQIIAYLTARYGDYIRYQPPFKKSTLGLWLGPFIWLACSLGYLIFYVRTKNKGRTT